MAINVLIKLIGVFKMTDYNKLLKTITQNNYRYFIKGIKDCLTLNDFSNQEIEISNVYN